MSKVVVEGLCLLSFETLKRVVLSGRVFRDYFVLWEVCSAEGMSGAGDRPQSVFLCWGWEGYGVGPGPFAGGICPGSFVREFCQLYFSGVGGLQIVGVGLLEMRGLV